MTNFKNIVSQISIDENDEKFIERQIEWALDRKAAIKEYWGSLTNRFNADYRTLYEISGGKGWYTILNENGVNGIKQVVASKCKKIFENRNQRIAAKLEKLGVISLSKISKESHTFDGFDGVYKFNTNGGQVSIDINTILAGGYNIQCLHQRTLIKVSK